MGYMYDLPAIYNNILQWHPQGIGGMCVLKAWYHWRRPVMAESSKLQHFVSATVKLHVINMIETKNNIYACKNIPGIYFCIYHVCRNQCIATFLHVHVCLYFPYSTRTSDFWETELADPSSLCEEGVWDLQVSCQGTNGRDWGHVWICCICSRYSGQA